MTEASSSKEGERPKRRRREVTPRSAIPQGTMWPNQSRSTSALRAKPWQVTQRLTLTPDRRDLILTHPDAGQARPALALDAVLGQAVEGHTAAAVDLEDGSTLGAKMHGVSRNPAALAATAVGIDRRVLQEQEHIGDKAIEVLPDEGPVADARPARSRRGPTSRRDRQAERSWALKGLNLVMGVVG